MSLATFWILIPGRRRAWEPIHHDIGPAVSVKIIGVGQKTLRIRIVLPQCPLEAWDRLLGSISFFPLEVCRRRPDFVALFEIGSLVPKRAGNHIDMAVPIKIGDIGAFGPELVR